MARWERWDAKALARECMSLGVRPKKGKQAKPAKPPQVKRRPERKKFVTNAKQLANREHISIQSISSEPGQIDKIVKVTHNIVNVGLYDNKTPENEAQAKYIQTRKARRYDNVPEGMFLTGDIAEYLGVPEHRVIVVAGTMNLLRRNRGRKDYAPMTAATARLVIQQFRVGKEM